MSWNHIGDWIICSGKRPTYLRVLAGNLNVVKLAVLELREVMTEHFQALYARSSVKHFLVAIAPRLKPPNVLIERRWLLLVKEIGLKVGLGTSLGHVRGSHAMTYAVNSRDVMQNALHGVHGLGADTGLVWRLIDLDRVGLLRVSLTIDM